MASAPTIYQRKQAARRATADIERLAKTYQSGLFDVVQQQQNAFTGWQAQSDRAMAPYVASVNQYTNVAFPAYQSQVAQYNQTMASYEQQAAAYRARLNAFQASLAEVEANPLQQVATGRQGGRQTYFTIDGRNLSPVQAQQAGYTVQGNVAYTQRAVPTFSEQAPTPPAISMPTPPEPPGAPPSVPGFDSAPFAAKRGELESTFKREVGERKAAKQNVVMRRVNRGMLQGA